MLHPFPVLTIVFGLEKYTKDSNPVLTSIVHTHLIVLMQG